MASGASAREIAPFHGSAPEKRRGERAADGPRYSFRLLTDDLDGTEHRSDIQVDDALFVRTRDERIAVTADLGVGRDMTTSLPKTVFAPAPRCPCPKFSPVRFRVIVPKALE